LVLLFPESVNPALAKGEGVEILVDDVEDVLGGAGPQWYVPRLKVPHVVRRFSFLDHLWKDGEHVSEGWHQGM
jgi:hypothetical protein